MKKFIQFPIFCTLAICVTLTTSHLSHAQNLNSMAQDSQEDFEKNLQKAIAEKEKKIAEEKRNLQNLQKAYAKSISQTEPSAGGKDTSLPDHFLSH